MEKLFKPPMNTKMIGVSVDVSHFSPFLSVTPPQTQRLIRHQRPAVKTPPPPHLTFPGQLKHQTRDFYWLLFRRSRSEEPAFFIFNPLQKQGEEKKKGLCLCCGEEMSPFFLKRVHLANF